MPILFCVLFTFDHYPHVDKRLQLNWHGQKRQPPGLSRQRIALSNVNYRKQWQAIEQEGKKTVQYCSQ
jgi:hypothetical protein